MAKRVLILCGPRPTYGFCPVPPLTNSAPERNVYRLAEFDYGGDLEVHVISACSRDQRARLVDGIYLGRYHHLVFPAWWLDVNQTRPLQNRLSTVLCDRLCHTGDLFTWTYLSRACCLARQLSPDLVLINSFPQYIRFVRSRFPATPLGLFVRGEMGRSRKDLSLLDLIITNSQGIAHYVEDLLAGLSVPIRVLPNSLEGSFCTAEKTYARGCGKTVIYAGRIERVKGICELLQAFHIVQARLPGSRLMIVGGNYGRGPLSELEHQLLDDVRRDGLNVDFIGQVPNGDLPRYYLAADLAVFPSICKESFGMVALEAMRCGLPVVASRRPGFEETVIPGETGLLVDDPRDIQTLAQAILSLLENPERAERMGRAGRARSLEYLPERVNQRFRDVILEFLG